MICLGKETCVASFSFEEDYQYVIKNGTRCINGFLLAIWKWVPDFRPSICEFDQMAVWMKICPLRLWK